MKKLIVFMCLLLVIATTSCKNKDAIDNFHRIYRENTSISDFCENNTEYVMQLKLKNSEVIFKLEKGSNNEWSGTLTLYEDSEVVESFPVILDGNEIVIRTPEEKRVLTSVLFFTQMDVDKCDIDESVSDVIGVPSTEEIIGKYPVEDLKTYMELFYNELLSNFTKFDKRDYYFSAINESDSFVFNRQNQNPEPECYKLSFGFIGNDDEKWSAGFGGLGEVSMVFSEITPYVW